MVLADLDDSSAPEYVRSLTDAHRSHMFDIVMQFRAIFYDADAPDGATDGAAGGAAASEASAPPVLCSWAQHRASLYVERLDSLLPTCAFPLVRLCAPSSLDWSKSGSRK